MNVSGLLLCLMALEAQIPVPDPAVVLTPGLLWSEGAKAVSGQPWLFPGPHQGLS